MRFGVQQKYEIGDPSDVAVVRRAGSALAKQLGFTEVRVGQLSLMITEAATNIVKHAQRGDIFIRSIESNERLGIEVIAIDTGPGISNLDKQMEDGHSTVGTYGVGLGSIKRIAQEFDIYSLPNRGAALLMIMWENNAPEKKEPWQVGAVCIPVAGEEMCGDGWDVEYDGNKFTLMVADGLGHGPDAAKASLAATALLHAGSKLPPSALLQSAHHALHSTRGAAVAIAQIDEELGELRFAGIGNIAVTVFERDQRRHLLSHNGIVGSNLRRVQEFVQPWQASAMIIAHTDGINTRWDFDQYPGLAFAHPSLIAAVLFRDFSRGRDDATVVVAREQQGVV